MQKLHGDMFLLYSAKTQYFFQDFFYLLYFRVRVIWWSQIFVEITSAHILCLSVWRTGASGRTDKFPVEAQKKGHTIRYLWNTCSKWMHWKMTLQLISYPASFCFLSIFEVCVSLTRCKMESLPPNNVRKAWAGLRESHFAHHCKKEHNYHHYY